MTFNQKPPARRSCPPKSRRGCELKSLEGRHRIRISTQRSILAHTVALLFLLPSGAFAENATNIDSRLTIPDGTPVQLRLTRTISSSQMRVGDPLDFAVENNVGIGDVTVIRAGSVARGSMLSVKRGRLLGVGDKVVFGLDSIALTNGETVGLRARGVVKGRSHTWRMIAGMAATGLVYLPSAPLFLLTRGGNSTLLKGTEVTAQIDCNTSVLSSGLPAEQSVAGLNDMMESLPPRVTNAQGREGDMVNLVFIGLKNELQDAFARARWVKTDAWNPLMAWHLLTQRTHDARLPMARFYMFGRIQDYSYALPDPGAIVSRRHHIRIWKTQYSVNGIPLWAGSASYDTAIEFAKHGRLLNHTIDPEVDEERDFVGTDLAATNKIRQEYVHTQNPVFEAQTVFGEAYHSDSRVLLLDLHQTPVAAAVMSSPANSAPHSNIDPDDEHISWRRTQ